MYKLIPMGFINKQFFVGGLILGISFIGGGCGGRQSEQKTESHSENHQEQTVERRAGVAGDLTRRFNGILLNAPASGCEQRVSGLMLEITQAIDARISEIDSFVTDRRRSLDAALRPAVDDVRIGPAFFRPDTLRPESHGWQSSFSSWADFIEQYRQIRNQPTNLSWARLAGRLDRMFDSDEDRLTHARNFNLERNMASPLAKLLQSLATCWGDARCESPQFTQTVSAFIDSMPVYRVYQQRLMQAQNTEKRRIIRLWLSQASNDYSLFRVNYNSRVTREGNTLIVPLDPGPFVGSEQILGQFLESVWRSSRLRVQIRWVRRTLPRDQDIYVFVLNPGYSTNASVDSTRHTINVYSGIPLRMVAHEFGHVLGLPDHSYFMWRPERCAYELQTNQDDLMSEASRGSVTDEEWAELDRTYPLQ